MDMLGTMVGVTGVEIAKDRPLDGVDLIPYLNGKKSGPPHDVLFWQMFDKDHSVIRSGNDKYIDLNKENKVELYDLSNDKEEQNDLVDSRPKKRQSCNASSMPGQNSWSPPVSTPWYLEST